MHRGRIKAFFTIFFTFFLFFLLLRTKTAHIHGIFAASNKDKEFIIIMRHSVEECVKSLSRVCRINEQTKTVRVAKGSLGNKRLGKLDYLTNYCGWTAIWE